MSVLEPESLRPSEEKIDPAERLEKAKKLKEDGNAKFKAEEQQMVTDGIQRQRRSENRNQYFGSTDCEFRTSGSTTVTRYVVQSHGGKMFLF